MDKLRLLLIYILCSDALKPADIEEMKSTLLASYPDLCLDSLYYVVSKKVRINSTIALGNGDERAGQGAGDLKSHRGVFQQ